MQLTNQVHPTKEQFQELVKNYPKDQPVVMINILRYKEKTGNGEETGEAAYARYGQNVLPFLKKAGGRLLWRGDVRHTVIGDVEQPPQVVLLVQYPNIDKFIEMSTDPAYIEVAKDRTLGLEYGGLFASSTVYSSLK
ncbi:MAG: DUF1330 domain-containing protein [Bacteroidota bacterium]